MPRTHQRFRIKKSSIWGAGNGLFTTRPLAKSEKLRVSGTLIRRKSVADECTRYADKYKFRVGTYLLIPLGYASMVNHSRSPNLEKVVIGKKVYLRPLRPIKAGEELFFRYSRYAQNRFYRAGKK